ncbi:MAG: BrnT family toxin [Candidatus Rokuibacteriota bacterium]
MFEWDRRKAAANRSKHAVAFEEAATVFGDPSGLDGPDIRHSAEGSRWRAHPDHQRAAGEPQRASGLRGGVLARLTSLTFPRRLRHSSGPCAAWGGPPSGPRFAD